MYLKISIRQISTKLVIHKFQCFDLAFHNFSSRTLPFLQLKLSTYLKLRANSTIIITDMLKQFSFQVHHRCVQSIFSDLFMLVLTIKMK